MNDNNFDSGEQRSEYHYRPEDLPRDDYGRAEYRQEAQGDQRGEPPRERPQYRAAPYESYTRDYSGGATPPPNPPKPPKKPMGTGVKVMGLVAIVIVSLVVGGLVMSMILQPSIGAQSTPEPAQTQQTQQSEQTTVPQPTQQAATQQGQTPQLDGQSPTVSNISNPVPEIASSVSNAVVGVTTYVDQPVQSGGIYGQWPQQGGQQEQQQQETERVKYSRGTGFVISTEGYIITNSHVVDSGTYFEVSMADGQTYEAKLLGQDATVDVAVLKIEASGLTAVSIKTGSTVSAGEQCIAIGNPAGVGENLVNSVTVGYVSAVDREVVFNGTTQKFIQTDAAINPGNSGGPLLNTNGDAIGMVTLKSLVSSYDSYGQAIDTEGIGFAIPIDTAMKAANEIMQYGSVKKPGIGIYYRALTDSEAYMVGIENGLLVSGFMDGSTASAAGVKENDIITKVNGEELTSATVLSDVIAKSSVGDSIMLTIVRGGKQAEIAVAVGDMNEMTSQTGNQ